MRPQLILWEPVHYHNLSELELCNLEIEPTCTATFWELCAQLASLKIEKLEWITQCPNLSFLEWRSNGSHLASSFARSFIHGTSTWDNLRELTLAMFEFTDGQLARIIGVMRELRTFNIYTCEVGSLSLKALRLHSQSLRSLDTMTCDVITPSFIPGVLASFPHLESLAFDSVMSQDIIDGPPWACESSLKKLRAGFQFTSDQEKQYLVYHQRQVLQKVSRLTNLKELRLFHGDDDDARNLDLRLENGLDHLATLKHLERFSLYTHIYRLSVLDVEWMIDNWKNLKKFEGYLNKVNKEEQTAMLQAAGIDCIISVYDNDDDDDD
ncbi:MAG: hypothetical protein J3Q66DRAFT_443797 [Benniella sp.]|nr:MAG: hypothetical protein J3Q66DRAFT_443797 [Benniella sp.]